MKSEKINLSNKFAKLPAGDYAVGVIAKMNDYDFKIVKLKVTLSGTATLKRTRHSSS